MTGGAVAPVSPKLLSIKCAPESDRPCRPRGAVLRERVFVIRGRHLRNIRTIVFRGRRGRRDDVKVRVRRARSRSIKARVPRRARSGRVVAISRWGNRGALPRAVRVRRPAPLPAIDIAPRNTFFFAGRRKPKFSFAVSRRMDATIELVNIDTEQVVRRFTVPAGPNQAALLRWTGLLLSGRSAPSGRYRFRLVGAARTAAVRNATSDAFRFNDNLFPIRGRHDYGGGMAVFGAPRGGRSHQGHDVFARCGTRMAAARGGKVRYAGYQGAAGHYVVIDGRFTNVDYVYMHLRKPPLVRRGQRVFTGQKLGEVGETGNASGCHLHFELWNGTWWGGGRPFDPLPALRRWDRTS